MIEEITFGLFVAFLVFRKPLLRFFRWRSAKLAHDRQELRDLLDRTIKGGNS